MSEPAARSSAERRRDTLRRLETDVDGWVATASPDGVPCMVPLSFSWDGTSLLLATAATTPTAVNVLAGSRVRIGIGGTRDVVLVDGTGQGVEVSPEEGDAFARRTGFDPRTLSGYVYLRVRVDRLRAWRESNELRGRDLVRDGVWLDG